MPDKTYVIGHMPPDLDSVAAAISYANFKNKQEGTDKYVPAYAESLNKETEYVLDKFGFEAPAKLDTLAGKNVILVDHNESAQAATGIEEAKLVEILDHHKMDFKYSEPIGVLIRPWGSSCSIIYDLYMAAGIEIEKNMAGLMLSAALVDTVISKSPTCTPVDIEIMDSLAELAAINDWKEYGMEVFKVRSSVGDLKAEEIVKSDFKDFPMKAGKIGIGQVETADLTEFKERSAELLEAIKKIKDEGSYHTVALFITDIINEGSLFMVHSDDEAGFEKTFEAKLENNQVYIDGIISRKKQVAPKFSEQFDK